MNVCYVIILLPQKDEKTSADPFAIVSFAGKSVSLLF